MKLLSVAALALVLRCLAAAQTAAPDGQVLWQIETGG
jgi:hypothetical protein